MRGTNPTIDFLSLLVTGYIERGEDALAYVYTTVLAHLGITELALQGNFILGGE